MARRREGAVYYLCFAHAGCGPSLMSITVAGQRRRGPVNGQNELMISRVAVGCAFQKAGCDRRHCGAN